MFHWHSFTYLYIIFTHLRRSYSSAEKRHMLPIMARSTKKNYPPVEQNISSRAETPVVRENRKLTATDKVFAPLCPLHTHTRRRFEHIRTTCIHVHRQDFPRQRENSARRASSKPDGEDFHRCLLDIFWGGTQELSRVLRRNGVSDARGDDGTRPSDSGACHQKYLTST